MYGYVLYTVNADGSLGEDISPNISHSYFNSEWGDLLTAYNGTAITYDEIGNPLSYYNGSSYTFTWDGRRLATAVKGANSMSFTYNNDGLRTTKTLNGVVTTYYYQGSLLIAEEINSQIIVYLYDSNGAPIGFKYRDSSYTSGTWDTYVYEKNIQGDIIGVYDALTGIKHITYAYYAWGIFTSYYLNNDYSTTAGKNPFMYRGYYYDSDLGMYYLQSRYYDPIVCRFINADVPDVITASPTALTDKNLFAYCDNNPIMRADEDGEFWNYVIGGVVGCVVGGGVAALTSYLKDGKVDVESVIINAAVGGISGLVAASGLHALTQAGITALVSGIGNFADQAQSEGIDNVNYDEVVVSTALGGLTSLAGTYMGKICGAKWLDEAQELTDLGQSKLLTGVVRRTMGQSHSALMRQGYKYLAMATVPTNISRGISSVVGTAISGSTAFLFNTTKSLWGW